MNNEDEIPGRFFANDNISEFMKGVDKEEMLQAVTVAVSDLLDTLLIDSRNDHNTKGTARRVAKMYIEELFKGRYEPMPTITTFPNEANVDQLVITGPITVRSTCSHHFAPITGRVWVGYIPNDRVVGLSKFNRIVDWVCSRPQIQEEATTQIADVLESQLKPLGLAVVMKAQHHCMTHRGVKEHEDAEMTTSVMRGFMMSDVAARQEFLRLIQL